ncbi:hypothetical protein PybrP1_010398 [[Pythium] brassicae (nom. inval.)]|nr:hypothetical protein PybrP1_010398 [[Pythium] brassicae (nom. inval.)]
MLEFFSTADVGTAAACFEGHSIVVPAVSFANVGQLALDLLVNTLLAAGSTLAEAQLVGHLVSENVPPIAGGAAFTTQARSALCLNLQVYQIASHKITIIQQRAAAFPGRAQAFAQELVEWAASNNVASLCVVGGTDDMLRHDPNMLSRPIRVIHSGASAELVNPTFIERFAALSTSDAQSDVPSDVWESMRGAGLAPLLYSECVAAKLPFVALVMACAEGDNVPDAVAMASHVASYLQLGPSPAPDARLPRLPFVFPPSWSQLFGRGPDVALYL